MNPDLNRLGVPLSVQHFFGPYFTTDEENNLLFAYGDAHENYGKGLHRPPLTAAVPWTAGTDGGLITQVFVCSSAMEAVAYLTLFHARYPDLNALYFCAVSALLPVSLKLPKAKITFLFDNNLLGKLWDIKIACLVRRKPVRIIYHNHQFIFHCQNRNFSLAMDKVSLSAFEKATAIRTGIRTAKPKGHSTFFEQLTH
jgi:hypothetical protein